MIPLTHEPTTTTAAATIPGRPSLAHEARTIATATVGGLALGAAARVWMRLIADEPAYTRSGTIFIVVGFAVFTTSQAIAALVRRRARRRVAAASARVIGTLGLLPLFVGAGAQMLPTVVGAGFASTRRTWPRLARALCLVLATGPITFVANDLRRHFGWSVHALAGIVLMLALYGTIVRLARPTFEPRPDGRHVHRAVASIGFTLLGLLLTFLMVGITRS